MNEAEMLLALITVFEERELDGKCGELRMSWPIFIDKVREGWNPPGIHTHWLDAYRAAIKRIKELGKWRTP